MLSWLTAILACQLAGELAVTAIGLPVPGPVCGMMLLFCGLLFKGGNPRWAGESGRCIAGQLVAAFRAGWRRHHAACTSAGDDWLPITVALIVSTAATIAVTALVMMWLNRFGAGRHSAGDEEAP